jgi:hypothetical protein
MLWGVIFDRERAYAALKHDPGSRQNAKSARFGLLVTKMRGGVRGCLWRLMPQLVGAVPQESRLLVERLQSSPTSSCPSVRSF